MPIAFVPPGDIAWIWYCHRLAPYQYNEYVEERFNLSPGDLLEPHPPFSLQVDDGEGDKWSPIRDFWHQNYPDEPFFFNTEGYDKGEPGGYYDKEKHLGGFDILISCQCQSEFLLQVSGEHFNDDEFLMETLHNYHKFLSLKKSEAGRKQTIVPTYQIDLMWQTHILLSITHYNVDCRKITSETLNHDDSLNDRTEGGLLDNVFRDTKRIWPSMYQSDYEVPSGSVNFVLPTSFLDIDNTEETSSNSVPENGDLEWLASSTSVGGTDDLRWLVPLPKNGDSLKKEIETIPTFIPANEKRKVWRKNRNSGKKDYVFGKGTIGDGYYHSLTRDAYDILLVRLCKRLEYVEYKKRNDFHPHKFPFCCCLYSKKETEYQIVELKGMINEIEARRCVTRPVVDVLDQTKNVVEKN